MKNTFLIIMAGGIGTRFWPISRSTNPKQFHDVLGVGKTMLQQTAERFEGIIPKENIYQSLRSLRAPLNARTLTQLALYSPTPTDNGNNQPLSVLYSRRWNISVKISENKYIFLFYRYLYYIRI